MRCGIVALAAIALFAEVAEGQARDTSRGRGTPEQREQLERRFRARLAELVRERLGLTAEQARQLEEVDRRYQPLRRELTWREMQVRRSLRQQVDARDSANQNATAALLDQMIALQRERTDLAAREQRELATFLTPVQRAQLLALQADLHRRVMNAHRGGRGGGGPGRGGPGRSGPPRDPQR